MQTVLAGTAGAREQTRARRPDQQGYVERHGVRVFWERYGEGEPAFLLPPTWEIVHSRSWKCQIPYLARHGRVVTFDPRGNGRSDRPRDYDAYRRSEFAADAVAVLDAAGVERAIVVAWCDMGESLILAAEHPERVGDRQELRERLGWRPEERVVVVTVGGSGVGLALLQRVVASFPEAARAVDGLRMVAVAGPRIDPNALPAPAGVQVVGHVPDLYRHLAACDLAVVQGGLSTTMELTACRRPFLYFPLRKHFEQNLHVAHRLARHHAGHRMDYATATPESIADEIAAELGRPVDYRPVETDGATRAATMIAELL